MFVYQFIRYDDKIPELFPSNSQVIYCFDLEDSIQDITHPEQNTFLKKSFRNKLTVILSSISEQTSSIGVRVNKDHNLEKDLDALSGYCFSSIILPKTESFKEIEQLVISLQERDILYKEIVPIIESKRGFEMLLNAKNIPSQVKRIAFGHCDYNADCDIWPYFHQDSKEYWEWVNKLSDTCQRLNILFINSPYLKLNDGKGFEDILNRMHMICPDGFGQVSLNKSQTLAAINFKPKNNPLPRLFSRLNLTPHRSEAKLVVDAFENRTTPAFAIKDDRFISPHEYCSAENELRKEKLPSVNFTFVGGCFPVQGDINIEDRFHQLLRRKIEENLPVNFRVSLLRYEQLKDSVVKINKQLDEKQVDILVYSFRPEPQLRMTKLLYTYLDRSGNKKRSFNLSSKNMPSERHDLLSIDASIRNQVKTSQNRFTNDINLLLGYIIGNFGRGIKKYIETATQIKNICAERKVQLLFVQPPMKESSFMEKFLSKKFSARIKEWVELNQIDSIEQQTGVQHALFFKSGTFANEAYHHQFSDRLYLKCLGFVNNVTRQHKPRREVKLEPWVTT